MKIQLGTLLIIS